jgi:GNAT superfamily N-acetyltransferase
VDAPSPTNGARLDALVEILHGVRQALLARDESPAGDWVERTAEGLRSGATRGWYYPVGSGAGVGFYTTSGSEAYGHVHVAEESGATERAERLTALLVEDLPSSVRSLNVGFTGLSPAHEVELLGRLAAQPGSSVIERMAMERSLGADDGRPPGPVPQGLALVPIRSVTVEALADLDFRSVQGTVDALLIGERPEEYRRVTAALLDGSLGRFLDEASTALYQADPPRLVGAILSAERSPRKGIFVSFMVDPEFRRRGYGRFLFRWGLRALWALGYERVHLWVTAANAPALELYEEFRLAPTVRSTIYRVNR